MSAMTSGNPSPHLGSAAEIFDVFIASTSRRDIQQVTDRWWVEIEQYDSDPTDFDTAFLAELAPELEDYADLIDDEDEEFVREWCDWYEYVFEHQLWLPLEQSCSEGVLLPMEQRALRLRTCPEKLLRSLRWFFELCPAHIKHHLALHFFVAVRIERFRRVASADWRPDTAPSRNPMDDSVFFRPPVLVVRTYTG
jgi:hypothetical protein